MTVKQKREFDAENERRIAEGLEPLIGAPVKRPGLFKLDDQLSDDTEVELVPDGKGGLRRPTKLEHKLAQMAKATQRYEDDEDSGPAVSARFALEVMKDSGSNPPRSCRSTATTCCRTQATKTIGGGACGCTHRGGQS